MNKQEYVKYMEPELYVFISKGELEEKKAGKEDTNKKEKKSIQKRIIENVKFWAWREKHGFFNIIEGAKQNKYLIAGGIAVILLILGAISTLVNNILCRNKHKFIDPDIVIIIAVLAFARIWFNSWRYNVIFRFRLKNKNNIFFNDRLADEVIDKKFSSLSKNDVEYIRYWLQKMDEDLKLIKITIKDLMALIASTGAIVGVIVTLSKWLGWGKLESILQWGIMMGIIITIELMILNGKYLAIRNRKAFIKKVRDRIEYFK